MSGEPDSASRRLLRVLEQLGRGPDPQPLADIAAGARVTKPTAHRLLREMVRLDWAVSHTGGEYAVGPRARAVATAVVQDPAGVGVEEVLGRLHRAVEQTVHVGMRSGDVAVYTHKRAGPQSLQMASRVGMAVPLHSTAIGKCLLAGLPAADVREIAARTGLPRRTPRTCTTHRALSAELRRVRTAGCAFDDEENEANIRCLAVPVCDAAGTVVAAISVSTVTFLVDRERLEGWQPILTAAATELAALIG